MRFVLLVGILLNLAACASYRVYNGEEKFEPQPVLSPPASDINAIPHSYTVPAAPGVTTPQP